MITINDSAERERFECAETLVGYTALFDCIPNKPGEFLKYMMETRPDMFGRVKELKARHFNVRIH